MKIWRLENPIDPKFARAGWRGAWSQGALCGSCTGSSEERVKPLIVAWQQGSDLIGDFTCTAAGCDGFMMTDRVFRDLTSNFRGFEGGPVEMVRDDESDDATPGEEPSGPCVELPYRGPRLFELWVTAYVHMDAVRSTAKLTKKCDLCGFRRYEVTGIESKTSKWNPVKRDLDDLWVAREPGKGIFVRSEELGDVDFFRVNEFDGWVMCTNRAKEFIEHRGFQNIDFLEMGDVL